MMGDFDAVHQQFTFRSLSGWITPSHDDNFVLALVRVQIKFKMSIFVFNNHSYNVAKKVTDTAPVSLHDYNTVCACNLLVLGLALLWGHSKLQVLLYFKVLTNQ